LATVGNSRVLHLDAGNKPSGGCPQHGTCYDQIGRQRFGRLLDKFVHMEQLRRIGSSREDIPEIGMRLVRRHSEQYDLSGIDLSSVDSQLQRAGFLSPRS
jgi:hypothetical protein